MSDTECLQSLLICFQYLMYSAYYNSFSFAFFGSGIKPNLGFSWDVNFVTGEQNIQEFSVRTKIGDPESAGVLKMLCICKIMKFDFSKF